ncbi:hypothetical protein BGZ75_008116 [Mortierella antarctica]|nr:hypothetical protein BGZ75_008116 [Mortierella antarctica]
MKIATFAVAVLAVACTVALAAPVSEKRAILDADITKADVGNNGSIVKVKPTRVSVGKKGEGLAHVQTGGANVLGDTVAVAPARVNVL